MWTIIYKQYILIITYNATQNKLPLGANLLQKSIPPHHRRCSHVRFNSIPPHHPDGLRGSPGRSGGKRNSCADPLRIPLHDRRSVPYVLLRAAVDRRFFRPKHPSHSRQSLLHVLYHPAVRGPYHPGGTVPFGSTGTTSSPTRIWAVSGRKRRLPPSSAGP